MILSLLISLLLNLLESYILSLIEKWLGLQAGSPTSNYFAIQKPEFMLKVQRRWWWGSGRMDRASRAYDLAVANYDKVPKIYFAANGRGYEKEISSSMLNGIREQL